MSSSPPFRLRLLASPSLAPEDGGPLTGRPIQRHRLALLALLARSPSSGVPRDVLQAYLWPESDLERARNLLNVSVYVLRQALGEDAILSAGNALRLAPDVVGVDVIAFESALEAGDRERAVALYDGPFLEGFFLKDAPEFAHWVDRERARLSDAYGKALESLAEGAERRRDMTGAAEWWKTLAAHDPFDSRVALRLMRAFATSGRRARALRHAESHERLLEEELGIELPGEVSAMVEQLRLEPAGEAASDEEELAQVGGVRAGQEPNAAVAQPAEAQEAEDGSALRAVAPAAATIPRGVSGARRRRAALAAVPLLAAATIFLSWPWVRSHVFGAAAGESSIAVLPLVHRGDDPRDAVLADGMTEELITSLARAGLRVIASTSVFALRDRQSDVRGVAATLGVTYVLEGDFQTSGSRLRVRLGLADGRDGSIRWSRTYERELDDVFAVQEDIARAVARELGAPLGRSERVVPGRPPTTSVAAWELYRRASRTEVLRSDSAAGEALALLLQAVRLDSTFAGAHAALARLHMRVAPLEDPGMSRADHLALARRHALRATELDDSLAEAHATLALVEMFLYHFETAEAQLERALELDPSHSLARQWLARLHIWTGRFEDALGQAERALEDDPLSATARAEFARALLVNGRCDEALAQLAMLADLVPPLLRAGQIAAQCHALKGQWTEALDDLASRARGSGTPGRAQLVYYLARSGRRAEAEAIVAELAEASGRVDGSAFWVALAYTGLGRLDEAFEWLDRSVDDHSFDPTIMEPMFADVQGVPRFRSLLQRVGLQKR